jgi:porphobilinogen synthase
MRMRRLRSSEWIRELVAETRLYSSDLIMPLFICEGRGVRQPVESMPGVFRLSIDQAIEVAKRCKDAGIKLIALFPVIDQSLKDEKASAALDSKNIMCRAIREIKKQVPGIGVMVDVALDPYTTHGHDGVLINGVVDNDATVEILVKKSVLLAQAGCDVVAPSDMMDGRVVMIREALESEELCNTIIMSYAAKYSSAFYGPFRDAAGSKLKSGAYLDKRGYQIDVRNSLEAMREVEIDESEGADMLIIKPGMPYLDVISKVTESTLLPVVAYQVSGEYSMMKLAGTNGVLDYDRIILESLIAFKRAGCRAIISYAALEVAERLL